jgi:ABC-type amino acid transport system permease subunit
VLAGVGGIYGIVEAIRDYPFASWFGVTLYVAVLGALGGFVLGLIAGALRRLSGGV